ncbi:hypothetical protein T12_10522 [Trichinella patagoniensis]|uniref:Uncharacterized protein n=1 Tax=Trichinella patagoniensis TaxID=990121 RepID=A0A0V0ZNG1_9BILA|nr:hypothetical protein T12_6034 [Trichinella patagoniensis]KRY14059.1 hypothetical protein T12_10522 [Trichinella patagoniensis]
MFEQGAFPTVGVPNAMGVSYKETRSTVSSLCRKFKHLRWSRISLYTYVLPLFFPTLQHRKNTCGSRIKEQDYVYIIH